MSVHSAWKVLVGIALCSLVASTSEAVDYFIAPFGGSDSNDGSIGAPFATFTKAISSANAGDTIFVRGGTYNLNSRLQISKSGTEANPLRLLAYPGESPILDFSSNPATAGTSGGRGIQLNSSANWWHIKGLTIQNAKDNGFYTEGSNGIFEQIITRNNRDSGFQLHGGATYNLVLNCDSYDNYDPQTVDSVTGNPLPGENADGFAVKDSSVGPGNIFRGNRAWGNSDDGYDTYYTENYGMLIQDCWAFDNGINVWGVEDFAGDGNGFKLGRPGGPSVLVNVLAVDNPHNGMDINGNTSGVQVFNSTSFRNSRNWRFDQPVSSQILQNNISYQGSSSDSINVAVSDSFNSWNDGLTFNDFDFQSLARFADGVDLLKAPRQADGSLPDLGGFLRLAAGSSLIDAGTPISFVFNGVTYDIPYNGAAPDLGAYEFAIAGPALPGDFNGDNVVDAADYTVWRNHFGESDEANINNSGDGGDVSLDDYNLWKSQYGQSVTPGSGGLASAAVPEPGACALGLVTALCLLWGRPGRPGYVGSRWTVAGEKAGRQTAMYSAPSGDGVL